MGHPCPPELFLKNRIQIVPAPCKKRLGQVAFSAVHQLDFGSKCLHRIPADGKEAVPVSKRCQAAGRKAFAILSQPYFLEPDRVAPETFFPSGKHSCRKLHLLGYVLHDNTLNLKVIDTVSTLGAAAVAF